MKRSKRYKKVVTEIDRKKNYAIDEGIEKIKNVASVKFDESLEISLNLGIDPKQSEQLVRGIVSLPYGSGKNVRVLVINRGDKDEEAKRAGADYVGFEEYIEKIQSGWLDFDVIVATPDSMSSVSKLGKILGKRGLMPNPKSGTVTTDIERTIGGQ
jgi:large subunit ribosomal protein L1